jgi:hypothetical protein
MMTKCIDNQHIAQVGEFVRKCEQLGYNNNSSLKNMKWDWCLESGAWFATYIDDKIISLSGIHPFEDGYRALFRGAQLYSRDVGLNRYHMQSYCFSEQLPLQLEYAGELPVYITTNTDHDASGRMAGVNRIFHHLAKYDIVDFVRADEVFYTQQNIWKLNNEKYKNIRL